MNSSIEQGDELELLLSEGVDSFRDLILRSKGKHPTELLHWLEIRLQDHPSVRVRAMIAEARSTDAGGDLPQGRGLALPHPIDAEWRFTDETAEALVDAAVAVTGVGDSVLLMGVPSVVLAAVRCSHDRIFWVRGEPNVITEGLKRLTAADPRFRHDLMCGSARAAAAVLDPPWYLNQFQAMLGQASSHCHKGAHLFVSAPPEGVRPGITYDRRLISEMANRSGLEIASEESGALAYRTPFFELNALRAAGIGAWLPNWRRGNLAIYRKYMTGKSWPLVAATPGFELTLSGVRLRLLTSKGAKVAGFTPLYEGEVFPSVSMRAPRRSEAALWTSGNRAFAVDQVTTLAALVAIALDRNLLPKGLDTELLPTGNFLAIDAVESLIHNLVGLAERELAEAASLVGNAAWDTSANDARFLNAY
jgi:hypothetical protein